MNGIFRVFPADPDQSAARIIVAKRKNASPGAEIFIKIRLCCFCDKVADYAKTIEREAERKYDNTKCNIGIAFLVGSGKTIYPEGQKKSRR